MFDYVNKAYQIAKLAHKGQVDKAGIDYIHHPETVANLVNSDAEKATAYLHDVIEDTSVTVDQLSVSGIPDEVILAVTILTKQASQNYSDYLAQVKANKIARVVKIADLIHNSDLSRLPSISEQDKIRLDKYKKALAFLQ
ncbi:MAG: GTP pyrophosphokinase [Lactococcus plantarum]|nr:GTP pyrophosphokinase [Lactococcus plantarum]MDN6070823.1 GTP pyrophosphokinase [Lactococcus plantarum]MDN6085227.1 GTP pyrophosphokinase [Lactococcus plantarum]